MTKYYHKEMMNNIDTNTKKWIVFCVSFGVTSMVSLILLSVWSTYEFHLLHQIIASIILSSFALFFIYAIDVVFIHNYTLRKHMIFMLLSTPDVHRCKVLMIGSVMTVSNRIQARRVDVQIDNHTIVLYLLATFTPNFHEGEELIIESKNRFIYSTEGL